MWNRILSTSFTNCQINPLNLTKITPLRRKPNWFIVLQTCVDLWKLIRLLDQVMSFLRATLVWLLDFVKLSEYFKVLEISFSFSLARPQNNQTLISYWFRFLHVSHVVIHFLHLVLLLLNWLLEWKLSCVLLWSLHSRSCHMLVPFIS